MNDYVPNPANYVMKGNPIPAAVTAAPPPDLSKLDEMTKEELITLIRLSNADQIAIALMDEEEIARAMLHKLAVNALTSKDARQTLENVKEWIDRVKGKAMQREMRAIAVVQPDVKITFVD